jgi:hypothetical protein
MIATRILRTTLLTLIGMIAALATVKLAASSAMPEDVAYIIAAICGGAAVGFAMRTQRN